MSTQILSNTILSRLYGKKRGSVFTPDSFRDLGNDPGIRKSLRCLVDRGVISRLARGLYLYPKIHPKMGVLWPTPDQIARALAEIGYEGWVIVEAEQDPAKANPLHYSRIGFNTMTAALTAAGYEITQ